MCGGRMSADLGDSSHDTRGRFAKENILWAEVGRGSKGMLDNLRLADPNSCLEREGKELIFKKINSP